MKKFIAVLLTTVLMAGLVSCASAYDETIQFSGIPWGENIETTVKTLFDAGYIREEYLEYLSNYVPYPEASYLFWRNDLGKNGCAEKRYASEGDFGNNFVTISVERSFMPETTIAGYVVKRIDLSFTNKDGNPGLAAVELGLDIKNTDDAYEDLTNKLTSVYGDPINADLAPIANYNNWLGADDSCILLGNNQGSLAFYYGVIFSEEALQTFKMDNTNNVDSNDVSGL